MVEKTGCHLVHEGPLSTPLVEKTGCHLVHEGPLSTPLVEKTGCPLVGMKDHFWRNSRASPMNWTGSAQIRDQHSAGVPSRKLCAGLNATGG